MALQVFFITNNVDIALIAEKAGVDRIWIDLETLGKEERQKNLNTVKSHHEISDICKIAPRLKKAKMLVRVNPWNEGSKQEIDQVINAGAEIVMLPMWKTISEVQNFIDAVGGRVKTCLLLETKEARNCLDDVLLVKGIDEIHIGLNDLHLSYGMKFMFELLADGTVEEICKKIREKSIPYGFGGISHLGDGLIPAEKIVLEHYRLGSSFAILSRGFCNINQQISKIETDFVKNMTLLREFEKRANEFDLNKNNAEIKEIVNSIVSKETNDER